MEHVKELLQANNFQIFLQRLKWVHQPYVGDLFIKIASILKQAGNKIAFLTLNNLSGLSNSKDNHPMDSNSGIYHPECGKTSVYIEQTGRALPTRLRNTQPLLTIQLNPVIFSATRNTPFPTLPPICFVLLKAITHK